MTHALETLERALDAVRAAAPCEVFQRRTQRVSVDLEQGRVRVRHGVEEGTAVRLHTRGTLHFGAVSGVGVGAARDALAVASTHPGTCAPHGAPPWAGPGRLLDIGDPAELPSPEAMERWLRSAAGDARASFDAALGVEALGTGDGLRACRVRGIVWARRLEGTRVQSAVARQIARLDATDWEVPEPGAPVDHLQLLFHRDVIALLPAAVAALAPSLVAAVPVGASAGPGWACEDDPADADAPGGGSFDDTGFPAERLHLADGRRVLAVPRGPGRRRRLSFREPPVERAMNLTFLPGGTWDGKGWLVRAARIQALGPRWSVVLDAARAEGGRPVEPWRSAVVRAHPETWVAACKAVLPPFRRTPEGVLSGTLVFQSSDLRVQVL